MSHVAPIRGLRYIAAVVVSAVAGAGLAVTALVASAPPSYAASICNPQGCVTATPDAAGNPVGTTHTVDVQIANGAGLPCPVTVGQVLSNVALAQVTTGPN